MTVRAAIALDADRAHVGQELGIREVTRRGAVEEAERWAAANGAGNSTLIAAPGDDWTREKFLRTTGFFAERR